MIIETHFIVILCYDNLICNKGISACKKPDTF